MKERTSKLYKKLGLIGGIFGLIAMVFNSWFLEFGVRTSGDWGFTLKETADTLRRHYFSIWLSDSSFGRVLIDAGQAPSYAVYGWLSYYIGTDYALNERLVHLWPAVLGAVLSSLLLARYIFKDWSAAALGAIIYSSNTYFLALLTGHLTLAVAYALAPLAVLFYLRAVTDRKLLDIIVAGLTLAACGAYEPRSAYILVLILLLLTACHFFLVFMPKSRFSLSALAKISLVYATPLVIFGLLNLYWVLGLAFAGGSSNDPAIESSLFGNEFFDMSSALTLFHPFWSGGAIEPFVIHATPLYFWLIPLAAFTGFAIHRKNRLLLFFAALGILGIFLSKQSDAPLTTMYEWLFRHMPGFNAFREASKFYLLTALSYAILIPALFVFIKNWHKKMLTIAAFTILSLLFLPNLIPVATHQIGATFSEKAMPAGYEQLNAFLNKSEYSRILWVPQKSRWSLVNANHPSVNASKLPSDAWRDLQGSFKETNNATPTDEINELVSQNYMPVLLSNAGIKYVVVPMRDLQNADNFYRSFNDDPSIFADALSRAAYLKETNIKIKGFKVYETNAAPKPYFSSAADLYAIQNSQDLTAAYNLWQTNLTNKGSFNFTLKDTEERLYTTDITDLFGKYTAGDVNKGILPFAKPPTGKQSSYYFDSAFAKASYRADGDSFTYKQQRYPKPGSSDQTSNTQTIRLNQAKRYLLKVDDTITDVVRSSKEHLLGSPRKNVDLYAQETNNLLPTPKHGIMWQKKVEDCAPYDDGKPNIAMKTVRDDKLNRPVRALLAKNHAACTTPGEMRVTPGDHLWTFRYRGSAAQIVSYRLEYNTPDRKVSTYNLTASDNQWHTYSTILHVPPGATKLRIYLITRPSNQARDTAKVSFTDVQLARVTKTATLFSSSQKPEPAKLSPEAQKTGYQIEKSQNLIPNGSFEQGLWKQKVGDCNNYDKRPALRMSDTDQASDGQHALQLEAKRHIACTDTHNIKVESGATYRLQFDYQSPNAQDAGYVITADDPDATHYREQIKIKDNQWHTYSKAITIPQGASSLRLAVFAYSDETRLTYRINRYDNFILQRVPDIAERFFMVSAPAEQRAKPRSISFQHTSNTQKSITIKGASKPFFLLMSEQYHPAWKLMFGSIPTKSYFNYAPWSAKAKLSDQFHLKANAFQNAWYIDPQTLCRTTPKLCTKNSDSTYDMKFTALFNAQRWFNFGLMVSAITGIVCVSSVVALLSKKIYTFRKTSGR